MSDSSTSIPLLIEARSAVTSGRGRQLREEAHLSQVELAGALDVSAPTVNRWENGKCLPRGGHAVRYAQVLRSIESALRPGRPTH